LEYASIYNGYETFIILSFAGANFKNSPLAKQDKFLVTNFFISLTENSVSISTSTHSQVAAGEVIALEKVFGLDIPREPKIGTIIIVVSFPGTQPIEYFTAVSYLNLIISHISAEYFAVQ
jgi:hypothetical protein